jgi:hypothetical protein
MPPTYEKFDEVPGMLPNPEAVFLPKIEKLLEPIVKVVPFDEKLVPGARLVRSDQLVPESRFNKTPTVVEATIPAPVALEPIAVPENETTALEIWAENKIPEIASIFFIFGWCLFCFFVTIKYLV